MAQRLSVERIIRPAVFEFLLEAAADLDTIFGSNSDIATVKEAMEIATQEQAIVYGMRAALVERPDVGGFERWEGMLLRDCASTVVGIRYKDAESPLV